MPDQFKNFLQKHRRDLDDRTLQVDLFDQIMEKSFSEQKTNLNQISKTRSISYYAVRIAAASLFTIGIYFAIQLSNNQTQVNPIVNKIIIEKNENQEVNKSELANSTNSNNIDIKKEIITNSTNSSHKKVENIKSVKNKSLIKEVLVDKQIELPTSNFIAIQNTNNLLNETRTKSNKEIVETLVVNANSSDIKSQSNIEESKLEIKELISIDSSKVSVKNEVLASTNQTERGIISLDEKVKKGIFSFLSKKSRQWSNNTIAIDPKVENKNTKLDIQVKTEQLAFNKSLKITSF